MSGMTHAGGAVLWELAKSGPGGPRLPRGTGGGLAGRNRRARAWPMLTRPPMVGGLRRYRGSYVPCGDLSPTSHRWPNGSMKPPCR